MWSVFKKEINSFFSGLTGYITIFIFLLVTGLFIWIFPDTGVLDYGFATLDSLFLIAPWIFLFLIPAITMRSFSEELRTGTLEFLFTKPLSEFQIVLGKYLGVVALIILSLLPTLLYFFTIYKLASPVGNVDTGAVYGSYIGLVLLGAVFAAIGLFASSLTSNQIIAFLLAILLCFFLYFAIDYIASLKIFFGGADSVIESLGIQHHYDSISRGVIDTRDVVYFLSVILFFLVLTKTVLNSRKW